MSRKRLAGAPAHQRRLDGAARRHRELRQGERQLSAARLLAGRARHARLDGRRDGHSAGKNPRHHRGGRRRVRAEDRPLSRIRRDAGRREEDRPAGALDVGAQRILRQRQPRPRRRTATSSSRSTTRASSWRCASAIYGSIGAYVGAVGANIHTANMTRCLPGMYDIKLIDVQTKCVFTHTTPTAPYRGAGRPEASYCLERVVDEAARVTGIDPVRLRKQQPDLQEGDAVQDRDRHHLRQRRLRDRGRQGPGARRLRRASRRARSESKKKGLLRGLGVCFVLEHSGGAPTEGTQVSFPGGDKLTVHDERAVDRPEPRHDLPAHGRRAARHQGRAGRPRPWRQRARDRGLRLGRLAHRDDRGPRDGEDA